MISPSAEVPRIQSQDSVVARFMDQLRSALNPILARVLFVPPVIDSSAIPTASKSLEGRIILVSGGDGEQTVAKICVKNSADGYEWLTLATST